jgi:hypothetical protein
VLSIGLLGSLVACASRRANLSFGSYCQQAELAPRITVRAVVPTSGITVLVLDGTSNAPLPQAQFGIVNSNLAAYTDSTGLARISRLTPGTHTLRIRAIGYKPVIDTLTIPAQGGRFLIVQIQRDVFCLNTYFGAGHVPAGSKWSSRGARQPLAAVAP